MTKNKPRPAHIIFASALKAIHKDIAVSHIVVGPECFCLTDRHHAYIQMQGSPCFNRFDLPSNSRRKYLGIEHAIKLQGLS